ncbi:MAG: hypothetical protein ACP5QN_02830, partial [Minisyncoccia bacterium]
MKNKFFIILFIVFFVVTCVRAQESNNGFTQKIYLYPGWNIVSAPRVLESYSFSIEETSDNFDIYVLNPESLSGWSTMAELGQTMFQPLFGYFINNKTNNIQTLTFNYKQEIPPNERLFYRNFSKTGWYSIGVANPTYVKPRHDNSMVDLNNPINILYSIKDNISSVIDFTNGNDYPWMVKVSSNWKGVNASSINNLDDFRDTKGYAIFVNNPNNALYEGFQNIDLIIEPSQDGAQDGDPENARFEVSKNSGSPVSNNVIADYATGR